MELGLCRLRHKFWFLFCPGVTFYKTKCYLKECFSSFNIKKMFLFEENNFSKT